MIDPVTTAQPPSPFALASGIGMITVAVIAVVAWRARTQAAWKAVALGAAAWAAGVALKIAWAVPTNRVVLSVLKRALGETFGDVAGWLYIGLLTGIFECGVTWLFVRKTRLRTAGRDDAIAFGIAFGAVEALVLGLVSFGAVLSALLFWDKFSPEAKDALGGTKDLLSIAMPIFERAYALVAHLVTCMLVVWAVQLGRARWFWASFIFKSSLDGIAAWGVEHFGRKASGSDHLKLELILFAFVACGCAAAFLLRPARWGRDRGPLPP